MAVGTLNIKYCVFEKYHLLIVLMAVRPNPSPVSPHSLTVGSTTKTSRTSATTVTVVTQMLRAWRCTCPHTPSNMPSCSPVASVTDLIPRQVLSVVNQTQCQHSEQNLVLIGQKIHKERVDRNYRLGGCIIRYTVYLYLSSVEFCSQVCTLLHRGSLLTCLAFSPNVLTWSCCHG